MIEMTCRLILQERWVPTNGRKAVLAPGTTLVVGRTEQADLVVPNDKHLSGLHFSLAWDGLVGTLRDLDSLKGTFLDGARVKTGEVRHGSWIRAGETDFSAYVEDKMPPPCDDEEEVGDFEPSSDEEKLLTAKQADETARRDTARMALAQLREQAAHQALFAILDAARHDRILELLYQSVEPHQSLYEGIQGEPLASVAPYLAGPFREDSVLLDRLVTEGWGRRWGIYISSSESFREVRRHFRRFLLVKVEEMVEPLYFRFYDPWVLGAFWSISSERQKSSFQGPSTGFFLENEHILDGRRMHALIALSLHGAEIAKGSTMP
ncbi:DUF4123 domain-containing protein [Polyangium sp. 15x6]|uniref:DUF4123 domain-containing protein n=1 Tax=Polyangium sp. 15x6 TaxID=3042687 RepID=UPI00249C1BDE|nr:DUF4123 domain-containing protein [Polyangium sp. 15x6]MDI3290301.1 DUF4123 domain-containing protein [Polyangium sp. 15x6]